MKKYPRGGKGEKYKMIYFSNSLLKGLLSFLIFIFLLFSVYANAGNIEGLRNYGAIREVHIKWEMGLWGSKSYYEKQLRQLLIDMLDREITTDFDYIPDLGKVIVAKKLLPDTYSGKWLHLHGEIEPESLKNIAEKGREYINEIEKRKYLFAASGKIRKYRLEDSQRGRILHLYLYSVRLIPHVEKK